MTEKEPQAWDVLHLLRVRVEVLEDAMMSLGTMVDRQYLDRQFKERWAKYRKDQIVGKHQTWVALKEVE